MFEKINNNPFVQNCKNTWFYKPARAAFYLTATALIVAAIAATIFYAGPYMCHVALGLLTVAKWTAIISAGTILLSVGEVVGKKAWEILQNKMKSAT